MLLQIHRAKQLQLFSQHAQHQQVSPCCGGPYTLMLFNNALNFFRGENTFLQTKKDQKNYVEMLGDPPLDDNHKYPLSYVKHLNFLNFEEFDKKNPIYINMVRHPVERVISWYYYIRQNWYQIRVDKDTNV